MESSTTGLTGLDDVLKGVRPGDNVVWQVERWQEYRDFVLPYANAARAAGKRLNYFRFASHPPLLENAPCLQVHTPDSTEGFERFVTAVHDVISHSGDDSVCVFDCLSELSHIWRADSMLGNFFMLTCRRLLETRRLAYFGLYRHTHGDLALGPIRNTTQFMLDVFSHRERLYIRPLKVQYRSDKTLNQIHMRRGEDFIPVRSSAEISEVLQSSDWRGLLSDPPRDRWQQWVAGALELVNRERGGETVDPALKLEKRDVMLAELIGGDARIRELAARVLRLEDLLTVCDRMIGCGRVGGKAAGMLIARAALRQHLPGLSEKMEAHDSFYIGTDVYFTFLVQNGLWWMRQRQKRDQLARDDMRTARERILHGSFPAHVIDALDHLLAYFGEAPFIVRSSSLLEDAYGDAFAGKYDSVFCVNQGPRKKRLQALVDAMRRVYASAFGEEATTYRRRRGLLDRDEQMALLLQRVSGQLYGEHYYPHLAGVGLSFNPYVWHPDIDPASGVVRLVLGLGTRAVDSHEDDPTRILALNAPELQPVADTEHTQRKMDALDVAANELVTGPFDTFIPKGEDAPPMRLFASTTRHDPHPRLTFEGLLRDTALVDDLRRMLRTLEEVYQTPVDVEFCVNFLDHDYRINLLQCRPFQIRNEEIEPPDAALDTSPPVLEAKGTMIGIGVVSPVDRLVWVDPEAYSTLPERSQRMVASTIGRLNRLTPPEKRLILIGPGRWGTREPSLGVPVRFGEISRAIAVIEIQAMHGHLLPDASLGTHFLNELIECGILYATLNPRAPGCRVNRDALLHGPNRLAELLPESEHWLQDVITVVDPPHMRVHANGLKQHLAITLTRARLKRGVGWETL